MMIKKLQSKTILSSLLGFTIILSNYNICSANETLSHILPSGSEIVQGNATLNYTPTTLDVIQQTNTLVTNWQNFSISENATVNFQQPSNDSIAINKVIGSEVSDIQGRLNANGQVYLINPNGVIFGENARIDVGGLVASTLNQIDHKWAGIGDSKEIINKGIISAEKGNVILIGQRITNEGKIQANEGKLALISGEQVSFNYDNNGLINVVIDEAALDGMIINKSAIIANGGNIIIAGKAKGELIGATIDNQGLIQANNLLEKNGQIILEGYESELINNEGIIQSEGGSVSVNSDRVYNTGTLDASGIKGGNIKINSRNIINQGSIKANGLEKDGGDITINFVDKYIESIKGNIAANGEANGGKIKVISEEKGNYYSSGNIEVIGKENTGGSIEITASNVELHGANIEANGGDNGGKIKIGGDFHGKGELTNANTTNINHSTTISANATLEGDGGEVVVWSDNKTSFSGNITVNGTGKNSKGGLVEVSSKDELVYAGNVTASGSAEGKLLLDPKNITIDSTTGSIAYYQLVDPSPLAGNTFGTNVTVLGNGNIVIAVPNDDAIATDAGAVYLYNGTSGALISTFNGARASDQVGSGGIITLTGNNNFVIKSPLVNTATVTDAGAATWGSGTTGVSGTVSSTNSLIGNTASDQVSSGGITALTNGNYVVISPLWNSAGFTQGGGTTWGNGNTGTVGITSTTNSLYGARANQNVGSGGVVALPNGNYVIISPNWYTATTTAAGAVTWGDGNGANVGSVFGYSQTGNENNSQVGSGGVTVLSNGNYVISSPNWNGSGTARGAATWVNGANGQNSQGNVSATLSSSNSLIGSTNNDQVSSGGITALTNGNFVVSSPLWDNGAILDAGASTWSDGSTAGTKTVGVVSTTNSIYGTSNNDNASSGGITALSSGNYVLISPKWVFAGSADAGAVTWASGTSASANSVWMSNTQYGNAASYGVGGGGITVLSNGNYVIKSPSWNGSRGAATWINGSNGQNVLGNTKDVVNATNSLVGSTAGDQTGGGNGYASGVVALTNGNFAVRSIFWANGGTSQVGAVTWSDGSTAGTKTIGAVSTSNSLYGATAGDQVSLHGLTALTNGNYVVSSANWDRGATTNVGAATWINGSNGRTVNNNVGEAVGTTNSLYGSTGGDFYMNNGAIALTDGNYLAYGSGTDNGAIAGAGAVTWGNGSTGTIGAVSTSNSLMGSTASDGLQGGTALANGYYLVRTAGWDNGATSNAGAVTLGHPGGVTRGTISAATSIIGTAASAGNSSLVRAVDALNGYVASFPNDGTGKVYLGVVNGNGLTYGRYPNSSLTLHPSFLTNTLDTGTAVTLQANNDITVNSAITVNNASGNGGVLTLQAGRSVLLNANITTDNANLTIIGNDTLANGVVDAQRDAGAAAITMAAGTTLNAGTGNVQIIMRDGAGKTNSTNGDITVANITANHILLENNGATAGSNILQDNAANRLTATSVATKISNTLNTTGNIGSASVALQTSATNFTALTQNGNLWAVDNRAGGVNIGGANFDATSGINTGTGNSDFRAQASISNNRAIVIGGTSRFDTQANNGNITLNNGTTLTGVASFNTHGTGNVSLSNFTSDLNFGASTVGGTFAATTTGSITDSGVLAITGNASFTSTGNNNVITLDNANTYGGTISLNTTGATGNASVTNTTSALNFAASTIGGNLTATTTGNILDTGVVTVGGTSNFTTSGASTITLDSASSYTGAVSLNTGTGAASITNVTSALNLGASTVGAALTASSTGSITDSGVLSITGNASFTTTGNNNTITLNDANTYGGTISLNTTGASGNASVSNTTSALNFAASTIGGNLTATTTGNILDSGVVTVGGTSNFTTSGTSTITLDSASSYTGSVSLNTGTGAASITNVQTALDLAASTLGGTLTTSSVGSLTDSGVLAITGNASFTTTGSNNDITLDQANTYGGTISLNTTGATGNASVSNTTSALNFAASTIGGNLTATTTGNILDSGVITVGGTSNFTTSGASTINLNSASSYTGAVSLNTDTGNASLTNVQTALDLSASTIGGTLTTSSVGSLTDSGILAITGNASFTTTGSNNDITLDQANTYGGTISLNTTGATGNASLTNTTSALIFAASSVGGNLTASTSSNITDVGNISVGGNSSFSTSGVGTNITLDNANTYTGTIALNTNIGNASVTNTTSALNFAASTIGGNLTATTTGNILDSGVVTVGGTSNFTTSGTSTITLDSASSYTGSVSLNTGTGAASITNVQTALDLAASTIGGNLTTSSVGSLTDSGVLAITGNASFTSTGNNNDITLDNANTYGGTISLNTTGATGNASVSNTTSALNFAASTIGGNLSATTTGNILDSGVITVSGTSNFTTSGASTINLNSASSYTGAVSLNTDLGSDISITNVNSNLDLAASNIGGNFTALSVGDLTDSGTLSITGNAAFTVTGAGKNITLNNANTYGGTISLNTVNGNASVSNTSSILDFAASAVVGNLSANTTDDIIDTGVISVLGNANFTTSGVGKNITFNSANNFSGTISLNTNNGNATISGTSSDLNFAASNIGNILSVTTSGDISDSGIITVTNNSDFTTTGIGKHIIFNNANVFGGTVSLNTNDGNASLTGTSSDLNFAASSVGGNFTASTAGIITDTGVLTIGGNSSFSTTGIMKAITLNNANSYGALISLNTVAGNASLSGTTSNINFSNSSVNGDLTISTDGNISDTGILNVTGISTLTTTAGNNSIIFDSANVFGTRVNATANGSGDISFTNVIGNFRAGTLIARDITINNNGSILDGDGSATFNIDATRDVNFDTGGTIGLFTNPLRVRAAQIASANASIKDANCACVTIDGAIGDNTIHYDPTIIGKVILNGTVLFEGTTPCTGGGGGGGGGSGGGGNPAPIEYFKTIFAYPHLSKAVTNYISLKLPKVLIDDLIEIISIDSINIENNYNDYNRENLEHERLDYDNLLPINAI
ncbi:MAG: hypothetical protein J0H68_03000 [Sphingobacteriia bacterium]|nr:hypothetical protein [Sphingobacteriia bacterium]